MINFPDCKINLGLNITGKRTDGYHDLESFFLPVPLFDALEIIEVPNKTTLEISGNDLTPDENNLVVKAWHLLKKDFPHLPPVRILLHKAIPMGAGLGGGSSNGSHMLLLLNNKFSLQLNTQDLFEYALQLGSDCPFFIINKPAIVSGRGEYVTPMNIHLEGYQLAIIYPGVSISTKNIFSYITPSIPNKTIREIIQQPITTWKHELKNDFEEIVFLKNPEFRVIKNLFYESGATYASMTGTGSALYAFYPKDINVPSDEFKNYFFRVFPSIQMV
ncbi:MAG: 4-(cytidine 5'-diphospho)-2-C-methyl-D-erythritol kinase [Bacteroidetes bacterium]|nr:4-(cytidine 5'-diphospho)-2-C-methyl-D-erythritol kinase [Bacteroidota bacterium]